MRVRILAAALMTATLTACATTGAATPIEAAWSGKEAGKFFAAYGPPSSDRSEAGLTVYNWTGGYKTVKGRSYRCSAVISVDKSYTIRSIRVIGDRPGVNGPSYCEELLVGSN
jgi:hypothetical protein